MLSATPPRRRLNANNKTASSIAVKERTTDLAASERLRDDL
jgi:hypothetical protein